MTTSTSDAAVKAAKATTTADDTLKQKSRDASVISGGHLVARALKAEGVDTIFTLCGGHIIDTSRPRPMPPTATLGKPASSAVW